MREISLAVSSHSQVRAVDLVRNNEALRTHSSYKKVLSKLEVKIYVVLGSGFEYSRFET